MSMPLDWSQLPAELLEIISEKITTIADYVRFRSVCSHWRSAAPPRPRRLPPQLPWLMLPAPPTNRLTPLEETPAPRRPFFDLSNGRSYELDLSETCGNRLCGSSRGRLLLQDDFCGLSLLNPLTRDQIRLSSWPPPPPYQFAYGSWMLRKAPPEFRIRKFVLSSDPSLDPDCAVMAIIDDRVHPDLYPRTVEVLAFCRVRDEAWTTSEEPDFDSGGIMDLTHVGGRFCTVSWDGRVTFYDAGPPWKAEVYTTELDNMCLDGRVTFYDCRDNMCLVESSSRDLLMLAWDSETGDGGRIEYCMLKLFVFFDGQPQWLEVTSIGDSMIFLGCRKQCFALPASNFGGPIWRRNRIYYTYPFDALEHTDCLRSHAIKSYSLRDGSFQQIKNCTGLSFRTWGPEHIWIVPSLC